MKQALVTGGTGFIGRALAGRLPKAGYSVRVTSRRRPEDVIMPGVEAVQTSFKDDESLEKAVGGCDIIFHLAAAISGYSPSDYEKANTQATARLACACARSNPNLKRFVYVSSLAAGGPSCDPDKPRTEETEDNPVSAYGRTKRGGENELKRLLPGVEKVILRPSIVYGKNDKGISQIAGWVRRGIMLKPGRGEAFFSFIYIDDLVETLLVAAENPGTANKTYYVCEEKSYPWTNFIAETAAAMLVKNPRVLNMPKMPMFCVAGAYEILSKLLGVEPMLNRDKVLEACAGHWIASPKKWMRDTGWTKWTPLPEGLKKTFSLPSQE